MEIHLAQAADLPAIVEISNWAAMNTIANFAVEAEPLAEWERDFEATRESHPWFVARDETGAVVGFAKAAPWKGRCAYAFAVEVTVYVRPEHHGRGVGRALYERLFATLRMQRYQLAIGGIALPNPASIRLHESFGLRCAGVFKRIGWKFGKWHDVGYWQGALQDSDEPPGPVRPVPDVVE